MTHPADPAAIPAPTYPIDADSRAALAVQHQRIAARHAQAARAIRAGIADSRSPEDVAQTIRFHQSIAQQEAASARWFMLGE